MQTLRAFVRLANLGIGALGSLLGLSKLLAHLGELLLRLLVLELEIVLRGFLASANRRLDHLFLGHGLLGGRLLGRIVVRGLDDLLADGLFDNLLVVDDVAVLVHGLYWNLHVPLLGVIGGGSRCRPGASFTSGHDYLS